MEEVFATGRFVMGPANEAFEKALAAEVGDRARDGVSSGTDALLVALMALGVGPGDEVITSPFTFFASAAEIARLNAKPVFVDIEPKTFNMDPRLLEGAVTRRTKAIEPIHLYGQCADMGPILEIAARRGCPWSRTPARRSGRPTRAGPPVTIGTIGAFSFYPTKNLGGAGDAGAVRRTTTARRGSFAACGSTARRRAITTSASAATSGWTPFRRQCSSRSCLG